MSGATKIKLDGRGYGYIEIDGFRLPNVIGIKTGSAVGEPSRITVDFLAIDGIDLEITNEKQVHEYKISLDQGQFDEMMKDFVEHMEKRGHRCPIIKQQTV